METTTKTMKTTLSAYCTNKQMGEQAERNFKGYVYRTCKEIKKGERNHLYATETLDTLFAAWVSTTRSNPVQAAELEQEAEATRRMLNISLTCALVAFTIAILADLICHLLS